MDPAIWGTMRWGSFRWGVTRPKKTEKISTLKSSGGWGIAVTRRRKIYGENKDRDSTTGWPTITYSTSTITGVYVERGGNPITLPSGAYIEYDAVFYTLDGVEDEDQILVQGQNKVLYYDVRSVVEKFDDAGSFQHRVCQLRLHPLYAVYPLV